MVVLGMFCHPEGSVSGDRRDRGRIAGKELETAEFSLRMWLLGGTCRYVPEVSLVQVFRQNFPYDHSGERWGRDLMMLAYLHFSEPQISFCRQLVEEVLAPKAGTSGSCGS
ncbi:hypothetical protein HMSSN036_65030 [Paenibacillus macerans]|nr:hypothetical protein HMSSN036_65030 [Paenibacillus macerans]